MSGRSYDRIASRQLGLVTTAQLRLLGWSWKAVRHAVHRGLLEEVRHGVLRTAGSARTQEQAWLAAVLAAPRTVLALNTGARVWAYLYVPAPVGIDLLRVGTRPRLEGVVGHRTNHLPPEHVTVHRRMPVTSAARTFVDVCGQLTIKQLRTSGNDAIRRGILSLPVLCRTVDEVPTSGRRAIVPVVEYLKAKVPGYDLGDSEPEVDLVEVLVEAGFPRPAQQVRVETRSGVRSVDVGWPDRRVGFEYDSLEFHVERFHEDRDRLRALKLAGWEIWPITSTTSRNEILAIAAVACGHERAA